jgi:GNAT superfamily N-acetyltransferase
MQMNIEYRLGTKQDLDAVCLMIRQVIDEMEKHGIYQWDEIYPARKDFEEDIEKHTLYLAYAEDNLAALYVISDEYDEQYKNGQWKYEDCSAFVLHRFCVSPFFQNQGLGKAVLKHIEEQVKDMGYNSIRLDVFTGNPFAQRLYLHSGYESRGYADWRKGRFDLLEKKL